MKKMGDTRRAFMTLIAFCLSAGRKGMSTSEYHMAAKVLSKHFVGCLKDSAAGGQVRVSLILSNNTQKQFLGTKPLLIDKRTIAHDAVTKEGDHSRATGWNGFTLKADARKNFDRWVKETGFNVKAPDVIKAMGDLKKVKAVKK